MPLRPGFSLSCIYELAFGNKRRFLHGAPKGVAAVISGWQVSGIWTVQSGNPLGFGDAIYCGADLRDVPLAADTRTWTRWFDTSKFEKDTANQLSNHHQELSSRVATIRGPRLKSWEMSALKNP